MPQVLPHSLIQSLQSVNGFDEAAFIQAHVSAEKVTSIRFNPAKYSRFSKQYSVNDLQLPIADAVPWCPYGQYLSERPSFTFDPLFHAGLYYVQEASSMFLWQVLQQTLGSQASSLKVLDLCAAPGGKSTLLASYFKDGLVVANEVIKSRANILVENITKWGYPNVVVTNNDPSHFQRLQNYFDVMVIDAPCSGSGLFRKDADAISEWSEEAVVLCSQRQQRIIADAYACLKQNGLLIYSTCSYSPQEDEAILDWMMDNFQLSPISLQLSEEWNIIETISPEHNARGYRFYPDKVKGEGFFIAAFIKLDGEHFFAPSNKLPALSKAEESLWLPWLYKAEQLYLFKQKETAIAIPEAWHQDVAFLQKQLYIKSAGTLLGNIKGKDIIPHPALALSTILSEQLTKTSFTKEQAIQYLQKKDIAIDTHTLTKGWQLAAYCGLPLGWMKVLPNRINNYYPAEWRILKN
ncbi:RNA methyltransferase [Ilyomonas limi]|uniref:RNA methyltransferase n=1 Tax=Ilyomonas limi TaxID=2575867 RepID=A0A4U3KTX7_9BACT|nr:RNA methyltransferase [Ilyomonas limi]TKK65985.1 RNA methyltransferase [Ilyomonas limi]